MVCNKVKISTVLATNLKSLREAHGLTLDELGKQIGVSRQMIWNLENEQSWITLDKVKKLSEFFGIEEDKLFQNRIKLK